MKYLAMYGVLGILFVSFPSKAANVCFEGLFKIIQASNMYINEENSLVRSSAGGRLFQIAPESTDKLEFKFKLKVQDQKAELNVSEVAPSAELLFTLESERKTVKLSDLHFSAENEELVIPTTNVQAVRCPCTIWSSSDDLRASKTSLTLEGLEPYQTLSTIRYHGYFGSVTSMQPVECIGN